MPLLSLWKSNPTAVGELSIEQVVSTSGDGNLKDERKCATELREYLSQISSSKLASYIEHCLSIPFNKSGLVLQDLINELGRRLEYKVQNGRYQGSQNQIGYDGLWVSSEGRAIIVEVKTTDAYRISLDVIARYRSKLHAEGSIPEEASILIVVGREDTGEMEAQVRGSRHAWDIRLISADALLRLVQMKENSGSAETIKKIQSILLPMEYTRLDSMVDVMFTAATDVDPGITEEPENPQIELSQKSKNTPGNDSGWEFTDFSILNAKREKIVDALSKRMETRLIKKSRALYWDSGHSKRIACSISKRYTKRASYPYWYAFHPQWSDFLNGAKESYFVLGCMDLSIAFAIPYSVLRNSLDLLNTTTTDRSTYWH